MNFFQKNLPASLKYAATIYLLGIIFFTLFRILLTIVCSDMRGDATANIILTSFVFGWRFDTCISCYILSLPFLIMLVAEFFPSTRNGLIKFVSLYISVFYCTAFLICSADIPYFKQFSSRLTSSVFLWTDTPLFMLKMVFSEITFWIYLVPLILCCYFFVKITKRIGARIIFKAEKISAGKIISAVLFLGLLFLGIRGRVDEKSPIRVGTAFFSDNSFANQLGLNPVFTFMRSWLDEMNPENQQLKLIGETEALDFVKKSFGVEKTLSDFPVARKITSDSTERKMNVVIVIMESMSTYFMGHYGGPKLTPVLDGLSKKSLSFENIYTSGIHTFNGIYSTLYSYPSLMRQHSLEKIPADKFYSMPAVLKEKDYSTVFFTTHDDQFDNMGGFLRANGFDKIISKENYPSEKNLSTLGVPDDFMFEFSIPILNELNEKGNNFFCAFMTGSNHRPNIIPENILFVPKSDKDDFQIVEYSDWAIGKFLKLASGQRWYKNTIFVFVADHGCSLSGTYDMPLSFHHSPLIIFSPAGIAEPQTFACFGGQMDIFPTLMGLMNYSYVNNTMGIDLLREKRPYIYFTADDKIGCIDSLHFFIRREDGSESLYDYRNSNTENVLEKFRSKSDSMRSYSFSMLQTTQWIMKNQKFSKPK